MLITQVSKTLIAQKKARKAFEKAQIDLKGAEEIKAKADMKKAK